jgi:hypothetical protein
VTSGPFAKECTKISTSTVNLEDKVKLPDAARFHGNLWNISAVSQPTKPHKSHQS